MDRQITRIPSKYSPQDVSITKVFKNSRVSKDPIGYELRLKGQRKRTYIYRADLLKYMIAQGSIRNAKLFKRKSLGSPSSVYSIVSNEKNFSLATGKHVVDILDLQEKSSREEIDYTNPVQVLFTVL